MDQVYLDNNATTRIAPAVVREMDDYYARRLANPSSQHQMGQQARRTLEAARERIGQIIGCRMNSVHADRIVFTSGGTESNNLALFGLAGQPPGTILVSDIEHPSVLAAANRLAALGFDVQRIPVTTDGVIDLEAFESLLHEDVRLVSVMLANNETGAIQPVRSVARMCHKMNVHVHSDAVQMLGKLPLDFTQLEVDALSISAHKLHGPTGIGALVFHHNIEINPILFGGFQQSGIRPGTVPVALVVGFRCALELWENESCDRTKRMKRLRDRLENEILTADLGAVVNSTKVDRIPNTSSIAFPGLDRQEILLALDMAGVACSTGSACSSGSSEPSPTLLAMGVTKPVVEGALRFTLGADTTESEIDLAVRRISRVVKDLRRTK